MMYLEMVVKNGKLVIRLLQSDNDDQGDTVVSEASVKLTELQPKE